MKVAKLFQNGQSQAVRLPKEFRFSGDEVYAKKVGSVIMLYPKDKEWEIFLEGLSEFSEDFYANGREQPSEQESRESLKL